MEIALQTLEMQTAGPKRLQVPPAREKGDVGTGRRQAPAEVPADAAASDDSNAHKDKGQKGKTTKMPKCKNAQGRNGNMPVCQKPRALLHFCILHSL